MKAGVYTTEATVEQADAGNDLLSINWSMKTAKN